MVACDDTSLGGCGMSGTNPHSSNSTLVGIIVGCIVGVLLLLLLIFCCRRERVLKVKTEDEETNLRRDSIAKIKDSVDAVRDSTALNDMSNVTKGVLNDRLSTSLLSRRCRTMDRPVRRRRRSRSYNLSPNRTELIHPLLQHYLLRVAARCNSSIMMIMMWRKETPRT